MQVSFDREELIKNARRVLHSAASISELSEKTGINKHQLYDYRSGFRKLETAQLETLLKFKL